LLPTTADRPRPANHAAHSTAEETRIAQEIVRVFSPASVLDASSSTLLQEELRSHGIAVSDLNDIDPGADPVVDLITCIPSLGKIDLDTIVRMERFSPRILFIGSPKASPPMLSWLVSFAVSGFTPDTEFDAGALGSSAVLLHRGIVWPPEALRVFAEALPLRDPIQRILELETEMAVVRRQNATALDLYDKDATAAQYGGGRTSGAVAGLNPFVTVSDESAERDANTMSAIQSRLEGLEQQVSELCRSNESLHGNVTGILHSRTWQALTSVGNILLRMSGRRAGPDT
jgi:hypothetical protein